MELTIILTETILFPLSDRLPMRSNWPPRFAETFFKDGASRYYGGSVPRIFAQMQANHYKDPFKFAAMQFNGTGSFGNGGAMRISPISLYAINKTDKEFEDLVVDTTRLTHTHPLAVLGALLQAFAICHLWSLVSKSANPVLIPDEFLKALLERLRRVTCKFINWNEPKWCEALSAYEQRFAVVKELLVQSKPPSVETVVNKLGNDLKAINSVPTALYVFLRSLMPIEDINLSSIPLRCLVYAISLGGDTDTIGTMACSLAGGFVGVPLCPKDPNNPIPDAIMKRCEGLDTIKECISWLSTTPSRL